MIFIVLKGIGLGLVIATLVGPVFFSLLQTSIKQGHRQAIFMALGISLSDAFYILLTYFGLAQFSENPLFIKWMGLGGGTILIAMGLVALFKKAHRTEANTEELNKKDRLKFFIKGFVLNFINPAVLLFWVGAVGVVSLQYDYVNWNVGIFFLSTIVTVFATDVVKIYVATLLSTIINDNVLNWLNRIVGLAMVVYGIILFVDKV
ncbi:MAG: LysE family translocator [Cytophagales bacterium]